MEETYNVKKLILYILIIIVILILFYALTIFLTNRLKKQDNQNIENKDVVIDYEKILVQNMFSKSENTYYVLAIFEDDENVSNYTNSLESYSEKENSLKVYTIDMNTAFNKKYISEESNFDLEYPIFKETTLLKIEDKKIVEVYEGKDDIEAIINIINN